MAHSSSKSRRKRNSRSRLKKAQLSFYPEPLDYAALKALSARTGVPQQVYLRAGLRHILSISELESGSWPTTSQWEPHHRARAIAVKTQRVIDHSFSAAGLRGTRGAKS